MNTTQVNASLAFFVFSMAGGLGCGQEGDGPVEGIDLTGNKADGFSEGSLTEHGPIMIDGDEALEAFVRNDGTPGVAFDGETYVISRLAITAGNDENAAISILNTTLPVEVRFNGIRGVERGIVFENVMNGSIYDNMIMDIEGATHLSIAGSELGTNGGLGYGVLVRGSSNVAIEENSIQRVSGGHGTAGQFGEPNLLFTSAAGNGERSGNGGSGVGVGVGFSCASHVRDLQECPTTQRRRSQDITIANNIIVDVDGGMPGGAGPAGFPGGDGGDCGDGGDGVGVLAFGVDGLVVSANEMSDLDGMFAGPGAPGAFNGGTTHIEPGDGGNGGNGGWAIGARFTDSTNVEVVGNVMSDLSGGIGAPGAAGGFNGWGSGAAGGDGGDGGSGVGIFFAQCSNVSVSQNDVSDLDGEMAGIGGFGAGIIGIQGDGGSGGNGGSAIGILFFQTSAGSLDAVASSNTIDVGLFDAGMAMYGGIGGHWGASGVVEEVYETTEERLHHPVDPDLVVIFSEDFGTPREVEVPEGLSYDEEWELRDAIELDMINEIRERDERWQQWGSLCSTAEGCAARWAPRLREAQEGDLALPADWYTSPGAPESVTSTSIAATTSATMPIFDFSGCRGVELTVTHEYDHYVGQGDGATIRVRSRVQSGEPYTETVLAGFSISTEGPTTETFALDAGSHDNVVIVDFIYDLAFASDWRIYEVRITGRGANCEIAWTPN